MRLVDLSIVDAFSLADETRITPLRLQMADGFKLADLPPSGNWRRGIEHIDVGQELTRVEWESARTHRLAQGTTFPGLPEEGSLFYRTDRHMGHIYDGRTWKGLPIIPATLVVAASDSRDKARADYICDGTDDQTEINDAIAALSTTGGTVVLLEGTYSISGSINLSSLTALVGQGAGTVLKVPDGHNATIYVIYGSGVDHVLVRNLRIDGNRAMQTAGTMAGIVFLDVTHSEISNCWSENFRNDGIYLETSYDNVVAGNLTRNNYYMGVELSYADRNTITGNVSLTDGTPIWLDHSSNNTIVGNICDSDTSEGIYLQYSCNGNTITGNTVRGVESDGIIISFASDYNTVTGNTVQGCDQRGIYVYRSSNNTVVSNTIAGNSQGADNTWDGILIDDDSDYNNVQGNTVRHAGGAKQHRYGIRVNSSDCDGNLITNNDLHLAGKTADYSDTGTGTVTAAGNRT